MFPYRYVDFKKSVNIRDFPMKILLCILLSTIELRPYK